MIGVALAAVVSIGNPANPQEPGKPSKRVETLPPIPPPPPDEAKSEGTPRDFHYSTDEAIKFFEARVAKSPRDFHSLRYLGELYERKARESGDAAGFERAEAVLKKALELHPDYPRAKASLAAVYCSRH